MYNERTDNIKPMAIKPKKRSTKTNLPIRLRLLSNDLLKRSVLYASPPTPPGMKKL